MPRLLCLAVDALGKDAIEAHEPPNILSLMTQGVSAELNSTTPPITPPSWYTIHTGANPGQHGVMGIFSLADPEHYGPAQGKTYLTSLQHMRYLRFWERAALAGLKVVVRNVMASLPRLEHLADVGCVVEDSAWLLGGDPRSLPRARRGQPVEDVRARLEKKRAGFADLARDRSVDVLCLGLNELDYTMHQHGIRSAATRQVLGAIDGIVGDLLRHVGDDCSVLVVSDHGFTEWGGYFNVPAFLQRRGLLTLADDGIDFARSRVFPTCCSKIESSVWEFGVYVNQRGRQQRGLVPPEEGDLLLAEIAEELEQSLGFSCLKSEEYYHGPCSSWGPDLLVHPPADRRYFPCTFYASEHELTLRNFDTHSQWGIAAVRADADVEAPCDVEQVACLALDLLGLAAAAPTEAEKAPVYQSQHDEAKVIQRLRHLGYLG